MRTVVSLSNAHDVELPDRFRDDDVRFPSALVELFLAEFTKEGDAVLDPFAGFGTTLFAAQGMGRVPYGIEYDADRCDYIEARLARGRIVHGSALRLESYDLPRIDFSMTSPPYMRPHDKENPLTAYTTEDGDYERYLQDLTSVYASLRQRLRAGARAVVEVSNLKHERGVTPLAWHVAERISEVLTFEGEVIVAWDAYGYGYDHSYCLVFSRP